jgi:hypothetical protein
MNIWSWVAYSVADPRSGAFLPQGSGMIFFPDPGSLMCPKFNTGISSKTGKKNRKKLIFFEILLQL